MRQCHRHQGSGLHAQNARPETHHAKPLRPGAGHFLRGEPALRADQQGHGGGLQLGKDLAQGQGTLLFPENQARPTCRTRASQRYVKGQGLCHFRHIGAS